MLKKYYSIFQSACLCLSLMLLVSCGGNETNTSQKNKATSSETKTKKITADKTESKASILFFGNSLTAGYGLDEQYSFPSLIQNKIDAAGLAYNVINGGLSGETTSGGLNRIDWVLKQKIDVFVLELGGNDLLRGLDVNQTEKNLRGILEKVRVTYPTIPIVIAGMMAPPNMGQEYASRFNAIYPKLAKEFNVGIIPFLLKDVATIPTLNLRDGIHPNAEGQKIVANNVWRVLERVIAD